MTLTRLSALAGFGALALIATPAFAQQQTQGSWTGFYVGGQIGYGFNNDQGDETILFDTNLDGNFGDTVNTAAGTNAFSPGFCGGAAQGARPSDGCVGDEDEFSWAVHGGFDYQFPNSNFVAGAVLEYGQANISDSVSAFSTTPAFYTMTRELESTGSLRARIGYALGNTLIYATGGVAYGDIDSSFATSNGANAFVETEGDDAWGYRTGGGFEARISRNISVGAQYLFTSLDDGDYRVRATRGNAPLTNPFILTNANGTDFARSNDDFEVHTVAATLNFRF